MRRSWGSRILVLGSNEDFPNLLDSCFYAVLMPRQKEAMVPLGGIPYSPVEPWTSLELC